MSVMRSGPMPSEARIFLEALFAAKPNQSYILLWTLPDNWSNWFQNVEGAIQFAESMRQHDLYVGVGLSGQDYGSSRRCPSNEVAGIVGLWADLDLRSDAHPKAALPATVEDALTILPQRSRPHLSSGPATVHTPGGFFGSRSSSGQKRTAATRRISRSVGSRFSAMGKNLCPTPATVEIEFFPAEVRDSGLRLLLFGGRASRVPTQRPFDPILLQDLTEYK